MSELLETIKKNVILGRIDEEDEGFDGDMEGHPGVTELVEQAIEEGFSPDDILTKGLHPGMEEVGRRYESGEYLIPDMLAAAECVGEAMNILEPHLAGSNQHSKGKFLLATVEGDLHDIGKNIVATMLRGAGFEVKDMGTGVKADKIVQAVQDIQPKYLGLSALLTTTMGHMQEVIDMLNEKGLREGLTVLVGGAPVSEDYAQKIGADMYCADAFDTIEKLEKAG
ncbi:cobalamin-binding protein [bacterium]|nr:cobalamin-binding protein [bacterium]